MSANTRANPSVTLNDIAARVAAPNGPTAGARARASAQTGNEPRIPMGPDAAERDGAARPGVPPGLGLRSRDPSPAKNRRTRWDQQSPPHASGRAGGLPPSEPQRPPMPPLIQVILVQVSLDHCQPPPARP